MKLLGKFALGTAMASLCLANATAFASSHREAPGITERPKVDNTDVYAFRSYEPGREGFVTIIANFQPDQSPGSGPNYFTMDPDAIYEIHIDNDGDAIENLTYQFKFTNTLRNGTGITLPIGDKTLPIALRAAGPATATDQSNVGELETYTVTQITGDRRAGTRAAIAASTGGSTTFTKPIDNTGNKTIPDYAGYANQYVYNVALPSCSTAGRVFVGQRAEAFAVNLGEVFDLVNFVPIEGDSAPGANDGRGFPGGIRQSRNNDDLVGKKNVTSIAIELPITCITGGGNGVVGVWSTASLPQAELRDPTPTYAVPALQGGAYVQVSRLGMPLVNELVIGLNQKDLFNAVKPTADAALGDYVTNPTLPAILDRLFRAPVNATLGTSFTNLAPNNFPRNDLVATFLTGIRTLNQMSRVTPSEMIRLNTAIAPTPRATQSTFGVAGDDLAGFPNGRRPGDDTVDITLRVAMGRLCHPVPINRVATDLGLCTPANAPTGMVAYTDGAPISARDLGTGFPYLNTPIPGSPRTARNAAAAAPAVQ
ncbi:DUF4331 domain-containing protein [Sphingomonas naphthae]|uniref:DUF4331 domain-containing protein n=1 Tax=Sphingomonas naphthae TaxID=1813468 RepID=A0ABY7TMJ8_9SPHN|nr:DUF4331 domain-containing protein [Sphingomonas naphthae]WCT74450.1 DUF4331 domain-containing protein [Sphingomonas naphthae]